MRSARAVLLSLVTVACVLAPTVGRAATIEYEAVDLLDSNPALDLWMYRYVVSGAIFDHDQGFSVYFSPALYTDLGNPPAVSPDWDLLVIQPDPILPSDGFLDALALVDGASLATSFRVEFTWLGGPGTSPGWQPFTINQFDANGDLSILARGRTIPRLAVPEPSTLLLIGCGLAATLRARRRAARLAT